LPYKEISHAHAIPRGRYTDVSSLSVGIVQIPGRSYISLTLVMFLMFVYRICLMP